ncbi:unnamed protein product [Closterium sp. Naga37s-1]|nr:unnamed protein product [Closterium sp. Naga37s-1]
MGLQRYVGLAIFLLVVTASVATTTAQIPKGGPAACPLPNPDDAQALGTLTVILTASLNGSSNLNGFAGDVNASGQACLGVYELDGDYNIVYNIVASTPEAGEPAFAGIAKDVGQERTVAAFYSPPGIDGPWVNLTRSPPSTANQGRKGLGEAPAFPSTYTYALNGTWLKASTLTTFQGQTYKQLVDLIVAGPDGYCTGFGTAAFQAGAAMGLFQVQPVAGKA